jgi:hypothetical protein
MIILLNHTIETQAIYEVKKQTNTSSGLSLLEQQYSKNGIVDVYNCSNGLPPICDKTIFIS